MSTDPELLEQFAQTRSEAAFAELVRRHVNPVHSAALDRVGGDPHLAAKLPSRMSFRRARSHA